MPVEPAAVVEALRTLLPASCEVRLAELQGRPQAVVRDSGVAETWVDLWTSGSVDTDADADTVARMIVAFEGWSLRDG